MTCSLNATSEISRLFLAIRMKRVFGRNPKPCNNGWLIVARKLELSNGLNLVKLELVVVRELLKPTDRFVPHWNPCWYPKSTVLVFVLVVGLANALAAIELLRSS